MMIKARELGTWMYDLSYGVVVISVQSSNGVWLDIKGSGDLSFCLVALFDE